MSLFSTANFRKQTIAIACSLALAPTFVLAADVEDGSDANFRIEGNNNNSMDPGITEGVVITSNGDGSGLGITSSVGISSAQSYIQVLATNLDNDISDPDTGEINIVSDQVNIAGSQINLFGPVATSSNVAVGNNLSVSGTSTLTSINSTGTLTQNGTTSLTGATTINTTGAQTTTIGNSDAGNITLQSGAGSSLVVGDTGTAVTGTLSSTGNFSVNTNKFTVDASTGNTLVGGTLEVTGATTLNGATQINSTLGVTGLTTTAGIANTGTLANTGAFNQTGASTLIGTTNITGATTINGAGTFATQLGGAGTGTVTVTSGTSSITTSNTGNVIVGSAGNAVTATTGNNVMTATAGNNNITASAVNNIEAPTNNIGVATSNSTNTIGNNSTGTTVTATGGNSALSIQDNTARLYSGTGTATNGIIGGGATTGGGGYTAYATVQGPINAGESIGDALLGATYVNKINGNTLIDGNVYINGTLNYVSSDTASTTVVSTNTTIRNTAANAGTTNTTVVDNNGKITTNGTATQATAALTVTNSLGNTHGIVVQEDKTTISGGNYSSSLTMADNGATFSDSATGAPVQVHGVADGTSDFDAVNVRQFSSAIASVTAMANIPQVDQDKTVAVGMAMGSFMGRTALAAGMTYRFTKNGVLKGSISSALNSSKSTAVGLGAAWSY